MESYFESTFQNVLRWELLDKLGDLSSVLEDSDKEENYANHRPPKIAYSLHREYMSLYGSHPKMEARVYSTCTVCEQVFNPQAVASHKEHCPGKEKIQSQQLKKKVKSKKKLQGSSVPLPPLFKKESPGPPVLSKFSDIPPPQVSRLTPDVLPPSDSSEQNENTRYLLSGGGPPSPATPPPPPGPPLSPVVLSEPSIVEDSSNGRHKKSKKSTKALRKYDPDVHCGVIEGQKGPCTRSITCSNHKIQLRKSVPGRSKNIHVLIAEKKAAREKETRRRSPTHLLPIEPKPSPEFVFPLIEAEPLTENADDDQNYVTTSKLQPNVTETELHEVESDDPSNRMESGYCSIESALSTKTTSPVLYFNPISPIYVVTPVQFIQKENSVVVEAPHSPPPHNRYFVTMPEPSANIKLYKSHPKPTILPTFGARKVGGAILSSNQRLEYQRNDIQMAITSKRPATSSTNYKSTSYNVPPQRSIVLRTKSINKVNCKRPSTEKIISSESKQLKGATDVNGFILHSQMSEIAEIVETPQPNHCIQENINLLNMK